METQLLTTLFAIMLPFHPHFSGVTTPVEHPQKLSVCPPMKLCPLIYVNYFKGYPSQTPGTELLSKEFLKLLWQPSRLTEEQILAK